MVTPALMSQERPLILEIFHHGVQITALDRIISQYGVQAESQIVCLNLKIILILVHRMSQQM